MSNETSVRAWGTEWDEYVIWGTHRAAEAIPAVRKHLIEDAGEMAEYIEEMVPPRRDFMDARRMWGSPELVDTEDLWSHDKFSTEAVDGWVPYMVVTA